MVEVRKEKAETKIERQLAFNKEDTATEVQADYPSFVQHAWCLASVTEVWIFDFVRVGVFCRRPC